MPKLITRLIHNFKKQYRQDRQTYIFLFIIFCFSLFFRVYRLGDLLGFYYDQGRDALIIWDLLHKGKFFLIGPTTGLAGIFLGPLFYYLIAPFYLIGLGNPVYPAFFLGFLSTLSVFLLYYLGKEIASKEVGLLAAFIGGFSRDLVLAGRWLSNPTPLLFVGLLVFLSIWKIYKKAGLYWWPILFFLVGISMHFEAASAVFYIPTIVLFTLWLFADKAKRSLLPQKKYILASIVALGSTLLPQLVFNFRHQNLLFNNFVDTFFNKQSFNLTFWKVFDQRLAYFWNLYFSKIFPENPNLALLFLVVSAVGLLSFLTSKGKKALVPLLIFVFTPLVFLIFYQGNDGNIYDYYTTGIYNALILLFAIGLGSVFGRFSKTLIALFVVLFVLINGQLLHGYLFSYASHGDSIILANQKLAVNWVFDDVDGETPFNVDVYVPPVIPHAYDYLFLWQGTTICGDSLCGMTKDSQVKDLYTLYELDPPHPDRLEAWLARQDGIGKVLKEEKFGGIIIQKRERL